MPIDRLTLSFRNGTPPLGTLVNDSDLNQMVTRINDLVDAVNNRDTVIAALQQQVRPLYCSARPTGFTVDYTGASEVEFSDGTVQAIASGSIAVSASTTSYIFVSDSAKAVQVNTTGFPPVCVPMATVVANALIVTQVRNRAQVRSSGLSNRPILDVVKNGNLSVTGGADVLMTGWTENVDVFNAFDPTTGIFTVPSGLRYMRVNAQAIFDSVSNSSIAPKLRLYQIATPDTEINYSEAGGTNAASASRVTLPFFWLNNELQPLVVGAQYRFKAFLPSGQSATILGGNVTRITIDRVG